MACKLMSICAVFDIWQHAQYYSQQQQMFYALWLQQQSQLWQQEQVAYSTSAAPAVPQGSVFAAPREVREVGLSAPAASGLAIGNEALPAPVSADAPSDEQVLLREVLEPNASTN